MSRLTGGGPAAGQAKASDIVPSPKICGRHGGVRKLFNRQNLATAGFGYCLLAIGLLTDLLGGPALRLRRKIGLSGTSAWALRPWLFWAARPFSNLFSSLILLLSSDQKT